MQAIRAARAALRSLWVLGLGLAAAPAALAAAGGPDTFGYTWRDSAEPGFDYAWFDPGVTATDVTMDGDDNNTGLLPMSFNFPYYGGTYNQVAICSNGWVSLVDGAAATWGNQMLPSANAPVAPIAAFWDDLRVTVGITKVLTNDLGDRFVVTWQRAHDLGDEAAINTFQVILHADGRIVVQYEELLGDRTSCTLGIESPDQTDGLTVWYDDAVGVPASNYAVEFSPPEPVPDNLDCASARPVACGEWIESDTTLGAANQDAYICSLDDFSGREEVFTLDVPAPTDLRLILESAGGGQSLVVLEGCDPNRCRNAPSTRLDLAGAVGTYTLVVDSPPRAEGPYRLRVECLPVPSELDCAGATPVACSEWVSGDNTGAPSNQDYYWCSVEDFSGGEDIYRLDLAGATDYRVILDAFSGNPRLFVLNGCDPGSCAAGPTDTAVLSGAVGTYYIVVDSAPGEEGAYRLRLECDPSPFDLSCAGAPSLACPGSVTGDTSGGVSNQDWYWCSQADFSGNEDVYVLEVVMSSTILLDLTSLSGDQEVLILDGCDPGSCLAGPSDRVTLEDALGTYVVVVDSAAGDEGAYQLDVTCLQDSFTFCTDGLYESDPWNNQNGSWLVFGWFYHPSDTHNFALRVDDGAVTYTQDTACTEFPSVASGVVPPAGPGFVTWEAPEGRVDMTVSETSFGGCCGLLVDIDVTNVDTVPHSYDFRVYHDTAFGTGNGTCTDFTVDGGPITVMGTQYFDEVELLPLGADTCEGQVMMTSAEDPGGLDASYEMLPPNLPSDMEFLDWNDGGVPCTEWQDLVDGEPVGNCGNDSSLLLIWRFPQTAGTLAPGETATARYRIGYQCAFPCDVACEDPVLAGGTAVDQGPCNDGIGLGWDAAAFPGAGNGVYHVRRSTVSFADARLQPPISPPAGLPTPGFNDTTPPPNVPLYYVIEAESLDFPGCGAGTLVNGSTDELELGPVTDTADVSGPMGLVGNTLRATAHTDDTVDFNWLLAAMPLPGESYRVLRSDDDPQGPFVIVAAPATQEWTDPDAPPRFDPVHVWFYDVRVSDECNNLSDD